MSELKVTLATAPKNDCLLRLRIDANFDPIEKISIISFKATTGLLKTCNFFL